MDVLVMARLLGGRKTTIRVSNVETVQAARQAVESAYGCRCVIASVPNCKTEEEQTGA